MTREAFIRKWLGNNDYTPENRDKMREDLDSVFTDGCKSQLELVAKTFRENAHKGSFNDQPVFQAIAETITNHPLAK